jgi:hypothetical protein
MKTYSYKSVKYGFQMSIPDEWSGPGILNWLLRLLTPPVYYEDSGMIRESITKTLFGPGGKSFSIIITPQSENQSLPSIQEVDDFFEGWAYRLNRHIIDTGTIKVGDQDFFCASYYYGLMGGGLKASPIYFHKKYSLFLNHAEYLLTASLYRMDPGQKLPTDDLLAENEKVYDEMVGSIRSAG